MFVASTLTLPLLLYIDTLASPALLNGGTVPTSRRCCCAWKIAVQTLMKTTDLGYKNYSQTVMKQASKGGDIAKLIYRKGQLG